MLCWRQCLYLKICIWCCLQIIIVREYFTWLVCFLHSLVTICVFWSIVSPSLVSLQLTRDVTHDTAQTILNTRLDTTLLHCTVHKLLKSVILRNSILRHVPLQRICISELCWEIWKYSSYRQLKLMHLNSSYNHLLVEWCIAQLNYSGAISHCSCWLGSWKMLLLWLNFQQKFSQQILW